jgi:hypothetical protein
MFYKSSAPLCFFLRQSGGGSSVTLPVAFLTTEYQHLFNHGINGKHGINTRRCLRDMFFRCWSGERTRSQRSGTRSRTRGCEGTVGCENENDEKYRERVRERVRVRGKIRSIRSVLFSGHLFIIAKNLINGLFRKNI